MAYGSNVRRLCENSDYPMNAAKNCLFYVFLVELVEGLGQAAETSATLEAMIARFHTASPLIGLRKPRSPRPLQRLFHQHQAILPEIHILTVHEHRRTAEPAAVDDVLREAFQPGLHCRRATADQN